MTWLQDVFFKTRQSRHLVFSNISPSLNRQYNSIYSRAATHIIAKAFDLFFVIYRNNIWISNWIWRCTIEDVNVVAYIRLLSIVFRARWSTQNIGCIKPFYTSLGSKEQNAWQQIRATKKAQKAWSTLLVHRTNAFLFCISPNKHDMTTTRREDLVQSVKWSLVLF
jgi:hypothetical protein